MRSKLPSLSNELYNRCYEALLSCDEFASDSKLQALFKIGELATYQNWLLEHEFDTKDERVKHTITYLVRQRLQGVRPVFPLLLIVLREALLEGDALRDELEELCSEVERELARVPEVRITSLVDTAAGVLPIPVLSHKSPPSALPIAEMEEAFLSRSDREWIIRTVDTVIAPMTADGIKNLLRNSLSDSLINREGVS